MGIIEMREKLIAKVAIHLWEWKIEFFEMEYMNEAAGRWGCLRMVDATARPTGLWVLKFCLALWALFVTNSFVNRVLHLFCSTDLALQETIWKGVTKPSRSHQYWTALTWLQCQGCCQLGWRFIFLRTWAQSWGNRGGAEVLPPAEQLGELNFFFQGTGLKDTFLQAKRVIPCNAREWLGRAMEPEGALCSVKIWTKNRLRS